MISLKQKIYAKLFGDENSPISTTNLYLKFLEKIQNNSKVLDVGVGTGIYFKNKKCIDLIRKKNISIYGIDISEDDINVAKKIIVDNNLISYVSVEYKDLLDVEHINQFDLIVFSESYPVIPESLMKDMLNFIINENKFLGKVYFINNIECKPNKIKKIIKPLMKYALFGVDFGRLVSLNEMENLFKSVGFNKNLECEFLSSSTPNFILFKNKIKIPGFNYELKQYLISIDLNNYTHD